MERSQWRALFPPRILRRGEAYYDSGAVRSLRQEGGQVLAQVQGQEGYQVEVRFCRGLVEDWACSCPYGREGDPCKHLAAVFLALEGRGWIAEAPGAPRPLEELVAAARPEQLRQAVLRLAGENERAAGRLRQLLSGEEEL